MLEIAAPSAATLFAVIAGVLWWKKKAIRFVSTLLWMVGICGGGAVINWFGADAQAMSLNGIGVFSLIAVGTGIVFYFEVIKKDKLHKVRTPIISAIFGISLIAATGPVFVSIQEALHRGADRVDTVVQDNLHQGAKQPAARK